MLPRLDCCANASPEGLSLGVSSRQLHTVVLAMHDMALNTGVACRPRPPRACSWPATACPGSAPRPGSR